MSKNPKTSIKKLKKLSKNIFYRGLRRFLITKMLFFGFNTVNGMFYINKRGLKKRSFSQPSCIQLLP